MRPLLTSPNLWPTLLLALALGPDDSPNYANTKPLKFYLA